MQQSGIIVVKLNPSQIKRILARFGNPGGGAVSGSRSTDTIRTFRTASPCNLYNGGLHDEYGILNRSFNRIIPVEGITCRATGPVAQSEIRSNDDSVGQW